MISLDIFSPADFAPLNVFVPTYSWLSHRWDPRVPYAGGSGGADGVGDRPFNLEAARPWLGLMADVTREIGDCLSLAQRTALKEAVRRVLLTVRMADEWAMVVADRVAAVRREQREAERPRITA